VASYKMTLLNGRWTWLDKHPRKGEVSKQVVRLRIGEQLLLPFNAASQSNIHQFARRFGLRVTTRSVYKDGAKQYQVKRVA